MTEILLLEPMPDGTFTMQLRTPIGIIDVKLSEKEVRDLSDFAHLALVKAGLQP